MGLGLHPFITGTVGLWQFQGDMLDSSGLGHDLTVEIAGTGAFAALSNIQGYKFRDITAHASSSLIAASTPDLRFTGNFTLEFIYMPVTSPAGVSTLISCANTVGNPFYIWYSNSGTYTYGDNPDGLESFGVSMGGFGIPQHMAIVKSGSTVKLYINGSNVGSTVGGNTATWLGTEQFRVGRQITLGALLDGTIASVRALNFARTPADILADAQATVGNVIAVDVNLTSTAQDYVAITEAVTLKTTASNYTAITENFSLTATAGFSTAFTENFALTATVGASVRMTENFALSAPGAVTAGEFEDVPICTCPTGSPLVFPPIIGGVYVGNFDDIPCDCAVPAGDTPKATTVMILASETRRQGGLNREARVSGVTDASVFSYLARDFDFLTPYTETVGGSVLAEQAPAQVDGIPGPYTYDPIHGLAVTATEVAVALELSANQTHESVTLDTGLDPNPALAFPDEVGYLAFKFGDSDAVGPVKYLGRKSGTSLTLDASFRFPHAVPSGSIVTLLAGRAPFQPAAEKTDGSFYVTGSAAGRVAAQAEIENTRAGGLGIEVDVVYPGDRGLGGEGLPAHGAQKLSDKVWVWGGDNLNSEVSKAREP